ncbi:hypothetical protein [Phenylobacterium sp.]|jgi:hypothetical protein
MLLRQEDPAAPGFRPAGQAARADLAAFDEVDTRALEAILRQAFVRI